MNPRVTVVILTYCNEDEAAACLETVLRSDYDALTILLVDNASPDGSGERLHARFPQVEYLQAGTNGGYTAGNNRGMEWALARGADYVLLLNDDTEIDSDCVSRLVTAARETDAAATVPLIVYYDDPNIVWYAGGSFSRTRGMSFHTLLDQPVDRTQTRAPISFACGCCLLVRADVLRELGGFDESYFTYCEDMELSVRLAERGHRMVYEPSARVLHRVEHTGESTPRQIVLRDTNRRRMVAAHYGLIDRMRFAVWFYPTRGIHLARYTLRGDWERARAIIDGVTKSISDSRGPSPFSR